MILDAHLHIADIEDVVAREKLPAAARDVQFFCNATSPADWNVVADFAGRYPNVVPSYGIHPWFAEGLPQEWEERLRLVLANGGAIGEIGLDGLKGPSPAVQKEVFERQVALAVELQRPFTLHCVHAWGDALAILRRRRQGLPAFIVHAFGASAEILRDLLKLGGCPSFWLKDLERRSEKMKPLLRIAEADGFLLETDFPNCRYDETADIVSSYFGCLERLYCDAGGLLDVEVNELKDEVFNNGTIFTDAAAAR